ncbi:MAG: hypothetical protein MRY77_09910 [Rhodobacteraceae bacterium]|jgi:hypothetical protein|nr:hypothetical protein [Paracoccaceae bacterium]
MRPTDELDPKGLMYESYRIDGITDSQCRSIFLDWALSLPAGQDNRDAIEKILERYSEHPEDHPMTQVLRQGLVQMTAPRRRGGWRSRER